MNVFAPLYMLPLKRFCKFVLKRVLGSFLQRDIDLTRLDVQLMEGRVELRDLELRVAALNDLAAGLPLVFLRGRVRSVSATVPWRRLLEESVRVRVDGLELTLAPSHEAPQGLRGTGESLLRQSLAETEKDRRELRRHMRMHRRIQDALGRDLLQPDFPTAPDAPAREAGATGRGTDEKTPEEKGAQGARDVEADEVDEEEDEDDEADEVDRAAVPDEATDEGIKVVAGFLERVLSRMELEVTNVTVRIEHNQPDGERKTVLAVRLPWLRYSGREGDEAEANRRHAAASGAADEVGAASDPSRPAASFGPKFEYLKSVRFRNFHVEMWEEWGRVSVPLGDSIHGSLSLSTQLLGEPSRSLIQLPPASGAHQRPLSPTPLSHGSGAGGAETQHPSPQSSPPLPAECPTRERPATIIVGDVDQDCLILLRVLMARGVGSAPFVSFSTFVRSIRVVLTPRHLALLCDLLGAVGAASAHEAARALRMERNRLIVAREASSGRAPPVRVAAQMAPHLRPALAPPGSARPIQAHDAAVLEDLLHQHHHHAHQQQRASSSTAIPIQPSRNGDEEEEAEFFRFDAPSPAAAAQNHSASASRDRSGGEGGDADQRPPRASFSDGAPTDADPFLLWSSKLEVASCQLILVESDRCELPSEWRLQQAPPLSRTSTGDDVVQGRGVWADVVGLVGDHVSLLLRNTVLSIEQGSTWSSTALGVASVELAEMLLGRARVPFSDAPLPRDTFRAPDCAEEVHRHLYTKRRVLRFEGQPAAGPAAAATPQHHIHLHMRSAVEGALPLAAPSSRQLRDEDDAAFHSVVSFTLQPFVVDLDLGLSERIAPLLCALGGLPSSLDEATEAWRMSASASPLRAPLTGAAIDVPPLFADERGLSASLSSSTTGSMPGAATPLRAHSVAAPAGVWRQRTRVSVSKACVHVLVVDHEATIREREQQGIWYDRRGALRRELLALEVSDALGLTHSHGNDALVSPVPRTRQPEDPQLLLMFRQMALDLVYVPPPHLVSGRPGPVRRRVLAAYPGVRAGSDAIECPTISFLSREPRAAANRRAGAEFRPFAEQAPGGSEREGAAESMQNAAFFQALPLFRVWEPSADAQSERPAAHFAQFERSAALSSRYVVALSLPTCAVTLSKSEYDLLLAFYAVAMQSLDGSSAQPAMHQEKSAANVAAPAASASSGNADASLTPSRSAGDDEEDAPRGSPFDQPNVKDTVQRVKLDGGRSAEPAKVASGSATPKRPWSPDSSAGSFVSAHSLHSSNSPLSPRGNETGVHRSQRLASPDAEASVALISRTEQTAADDEEERASENGDAAKGQSSAGLAPQVGEGEPQRSSRRSDGKVYEKDAEYEEEKVHVDETEPRQAQHEEREALSTPRSAKDDEEEDAYASPPHSHHSDRDPLPDEELMHTMLPLPAERDAPAARLVTTNDVTDFVGSLARHAALGEGLAAAPASVPVADQNEVKASAHSPRQPVEEITPQRTSRDAASDLGGYHHFMALHVDVSEASVCLTEEPAGPSGAAGAATAAAAAAAAGQGAALGSGLAENAPWLEEHLDYKHGDDDEADPESTATVGTGASGGSSGGGGGGGGVPGSGGPQSFVCDLSAVRLVSVVFVDGRPVTYLNVSASDLAMREYREAFAVPPTPPGATVADPLSQRPSLPVLYRFGELAPHSRLRDPLAGDGESATAAAADEKVKEARAAELAYSTRGDANPAFSLHSSASTAARAATGVAAGDDKVFMSSLVITQNPQTKAQSAMAVLNFRSLALGYRVNSLWMQKLTDFFATPAPTQIIAPLALASSTLDNVSLFVNAYDCTVDYNPETSASRLLLRFEFVRFSMNIVQSSAVSTFHVETRDIAAHLAPHSAKLRFTIAPRCRPPLSASVEQFPPALRHWLSVQARQQSHSVGDSDEAMLHLVPCVALRLQGDGLLREVPRGGYDDFLEAAGFARVATLDALNVSMRRQLLSSQELFEAQLQRAYAEAVRRGRALRRPPDELLERPQLPLLTPEQAAQSTPVAHLEISNGQLELMLCSDSFYTLIDLVTHLSSEIAAALSVAAASAPAPAASAPLAAAPLPSPAAAGLVARGGSDGLRERDSLKTQILSAMDTPLEAQRPVSHEFDARMPLGMAPLIDDYASQRAGPWRAFDRVPHDGQADSHRAPRAGRADEGRRGSEDEEEHAEVEIKEDEEDDPEEEKRGNNEDRRRVRERGADRNAWAEEAEARPFGGAAVAARHSGPVRARGSNEQSARYYNGRAPGTFSKIIENYVPLPTDAAHDSALEYVHEELKDAHLTYPLALFETIISKINVVLRIFGGHDWPAVAPTPAPPRRGSAAGQGIAQHEYVGGRESGAARRGAPPPAQAAMEAARRDTELVMDFVLRGLTLKLESYGLQERLASRMALAAQDMDVYDLLDSSSVKKFLCFYRRPHSMPAGGPDARSLGSSMMSMELLSVRPQVAGHIVNDPSREELRLRFECLPLRFNIDQDALEFLVLFFAGPQALALLTGDEQGAAQHARGPPTVAGAQHRPPQQSQQRTPPPPHRGPAGWPNDDWGEPGEGKGRGPGNSGAGAPASTPFIQLFTTHGTFVRFDYLPKRLNYRSIVQRDALQVLLLFPVEGAEIELRAQQVHGATGWDGLLAALVHRWSADIGHRQVLNLAKGLQPIRSLVNVGGGVADLVLVPVAEFRRSGKLQRGFAHGIRSFVRAVASETLQLGSGVASLAQSMLEAAQSIVAADPPAAAVRTPSRGVPSPATRGGRVAGATAAANDAHRRSRSAFASQPGSTSEGLRQAYASLSRALQGVAQEVVMIPADEFQRQGLKASVKAVVRAVPSAVLRPLVGATEAASRALLGMHNSLDPRTKLDADDKYKDTR